MTDGSDLGTVAITDRDAGTRRFAHDPAGRVVTAIDAIAAESVGTSIAQAERQRIASFATDSAKTQAAKLPKNMRPQVAAGIAEKGEKADRVAAAGAPYTAWLREHPHQRPPEYLKHEPRPFHLKPLRPWPGDR